MPPSLVVERPDQARSVAAGEELGAALGRKDGGGGAGEMGYLTTEKKFFLLKKLFMGKRDCEEIFNYSFVGTHLYVPCPGGGGGRGQLEGEAEGASGGSGGLHVHFESYRFNCPF